MIKKSLLLLFLITVFISGCSKYGYVSLNYPLSPSVLIPDHVKRITLVNRSLTKKEDEKNKVAEQIFTGEVVGSDRLASDDCLKGVFDRLNGRRGIEVVIPRTTRFYGTGTRETPELLDWNLVQSICDTTHADALLVLENFDVNTDLLLSTITKQVATIMNGGTPKPNLPNQIKMNILSFWRLYDPSTKTIIDQYKSMSYQTFNCVGPGNTLPPPDALSNTAYQAGQEYIQRLLPSYYTVKRDMYKRGRGASKGEFALAFRQAEVADWQKAIDIWTGVLQHATAENAGRACLNIAVGYEVLGNTDQAIEWAKKSYTDFNNKLGRDYSNILLDRKRIEY